MAPRVGYPVVVAVKVMKRAFMGSSPSGLERDTSIHTSIILGHLAISLLRPQSQRASSRGLQCDPGIFCYFLRSDRWMGPVREE